MRKATSALLLSTACVLSACGSEPVLSDVPTTPTPTSSAASNAADETSEAETTEAEAPEDVRARAAAKLMPPALNYEDARAKLDAGVGGLFIPSWADPELLSDGPRGINALRDEVGRDFEVSIDFEGGRVQRFSEILGDYPSPQAMAEGHTPEEVEQMATEIGHSLRAHGVTVDFAPVLDVDGGGLEVVGDRAFSTDPEAAGDYGAAFARGLQAAGIKAVFKHFPGHGRASGDTHLGEAVTPPLEELSGHEFVPFHTALPQAPEAALMMGHLVVPGLGEEPASLNPRAYQLAREELGFHGTIYTDDLGGMASISENFSVSEAVAAALAAGADMPLWSTDDDIDAVIDAAAEVVAQQDTD
ncbi:glycoside hydrolase family 3 N-terminal domain-containing protein [Corynebacterium minutissimum]|uniref:beta-N-acetylhexosaminidase n=1 Tax=Corynebacterium minutissimum TaxID=38301 RepID=A0A2X4R927_9CORY|nr:glycoside hydrolase family 3 N-terminal domain-containing protein [Corynebacterium minutissimum]KHO30658.1 beta-N-acetylglucosaminidase [Corynebacterium minutissimum]QPS59797.1 glycoside hydrolase family 3 protein [Corynebacterium minutissimum]QQA79412.1 glycoside hydrolase family 3 protein [Corynebacterium minutissimum]SQH98413.1 glycoside hydrolase [Corynebacterium minutissimum]VEG06981.1 glycoside hydrolase [Corynebacterium minutissimum]